MGPVIAFAARGSGAASLGTRDWPDSPVPSFAGSRRDSDSDSNPWWETLGVVWGIATSRAFWWLVALSVLGASGLFAWRNPTPAVGAGLLMMIPGVLLALFGFVVVFACDLYFHPEEMMAQAMWGRLARFVVPPKKMSKQERRILKFFDPVAKLGLVLLIWGGTLAFVGGFAPPAPEVPADPVQPRFADPRLQWPAPQGLPQPIQGPAPLLPAAPLPPVNPPGPAPRS